jgi:glutaredoxin 3
MKKITVYSTTTCPYCSMLIKWLKENNIDYTEYKVDQNPFAAQSMINLSGQRGVPFTTVEEDGRIIDKVLGFDVEKLQRALV